MDRVMERCVLAIASGRHTHARLRQNNLPQKFSGGDLRYLISNGCLDSVPIPKHDDGSVVEYIATAKGKERLVTLEELAKK